MSDLRTGMLETNIKTGTPAEKKCKQPAQSADSK